MKPVRVLDVSHILAVCTYVTRTVADPPPLHLEVAAGDGQVKVRLADHEQQAAALRALQQVGYDATADADVITVRGWSQPRLADRLRRLTDATRWLLDQLSFTPRTAIALYREAETEYRDARDARDEARTKVVEDLRDRVQQDIGPLSHGKPDVLPADPPTAALLRLCRSGEDEADLLLSRHRTIATQAIAEYRVERARTQPPIQIAAHDARGAVRTDTTPVRAEPPATEIVPGDTPPPCASTSAHRPPHGASAH